MDDSNVIYVEFPTPIFQDMLEDALEGLEEPNELINRAREAMRGFDQMSRQREISSNPREAQTLLVIAQHALTLALYRRQKQ